MSLVLTRARWPRQPQHPVGLAERYRDALIAWTPGYEYGRFGRAVLTGTTNTITNGVGPFGRSKQFGAYSGNSSTGLRLRYPDVNPATLLGNRGVTCLVVAHQHTGTNEFPGITKCGTNGSLDGGWWLGVIGHGDGADFNHWAFQAGGAAATTIQEDGVTGQTNTRAYGRFAAGEPCVVIGSWNRVTNRATLWARSLRDGETVRAQMTATSTGYKNEPLPVELLTYYRSSTSQIRSWITPAYLVAVLPRHVDDPEADRLLDEPWSLFAERRILVPMAGAALPIELAGDALASAQADGELAGAVTLDGDALAGASAAGDLTTAVQMAGDAIASAQASAALAAQTTVLVTDIDAGNAATSSSVTDPTSDTPTIEVTRRTGADGDGGWRHFLFAVEGVEGKAPVFRWAKASHRFGGGFTSAWAPVYTTDFVTWTKAPARTIGATWIEWSFTDPLPAGRVYVASHPLGRQSDAVDFAAYLLATHAAVASPTGSADASGVYNTTTTENDELGRAIGANPQYAIRLAWGGATTDALPKRKLVMLAGTHAAGEAHSWPGFVAAVEWMLADASQAAQDFRANWDVYLYFNVTANGLRGGNARWNFRSSSDPNRNYKLTGASTLTEITNLRAAIEADTGTSANVLLSFHGAANTSNRLSIYVMPPNDNSGTRWPVMQAFIDEAKSRFSQPSPNMVTYTDTNTDFWWGYAKLGCVLSFPTEMQALGESSLAEAQSVGELWIQTVQAVDADGWFYRHLEADATAGASASGALTTAIPLAGASIVAATSTGSLSTGIRLAGSAASLTLADGALTAQIRLQADALAGAIAAAGLTSAIRLAATAQAGASATGDLTVGNTIDLAGNAQAAALATGSITTIIRFEAAAVAKVLGAGDLTVPGSAAELAADATVLAIAEGGLTTGIALQGAAASVVQASGTLDLALTFEAHAFAQAMASGVLSTQIRMNAAAVASAIAQASLTTAGAPLAEHGVRRPTHRGYQRITARRPKQYA